MKEYLLVRGLNLALRVLSMGAKFVLIIAITKYLSTGDLGDFGLFNTTIILFTFFVGLDFYTYCTRELIQHEEKHAEFIINQFLFYGFMHIVSLPIVIVTFIMGVLPWKYFLLFYLIFICEHLSQELYRLFTTLSKPITANLLLFIRTGIWAYILIFLWFKGLESYTNLIMLFSFWLAGSALSVVLGIVLLNKTYNFNSVENKLDLKWITNGIKISFPFLVGTIAYKIMEFSNRYLIDYFMTREDVGIFTFFSSISNSAQALVYTLAIMIYYPKIIKLSQDNKAEELKILFKSFYKEVIIYSIIISLLILIFISPLLNYLNKDELVSNINILKHLLVSVFLLNLSFVPHFYLFSKHEDISIRNISIVGALLNVVSSIILISLFGLIGASISMIISFLVVFLLKSLKMHQIANSN